MTIHDLFNKLLAEEYQQWYSYFQASHFISGEKCLRARDMFSWFASDELMDHAHKLMNRMYDLKINNLLVVPNLWFVATDDKCSFVYQNLEQFIKDSIASEEKAVHNYHDAIEFCNSECPEDTTTINMFEDIKRDEEEHIHNLTLLLSEIQTQQ